MTYRIEPQCGHPSLIGGLHDHGPGCMWHILPEAALPSVPVATWAWVEGMTVETARRVVNEMLATSRTKVTP